MDTLQVSKPRADAFYPAPRRIPYKDCNNPDVAWRSRLLVRIFCIGGADRKGSLAENSRGLLRGTPWRRWPCNILPKLHRGRLFKNARRISQTSSRERRGQGIPSRATRRSPVEKRKPQAPHWRWIGTCSSSGSSDGWDIAS